MSDYSPAPMPDARAKGLNKTSFYEVPIGEPGFFSDIEWEKDYRGKNKHLVFTPNNKYEAWLGHGAIPFAFRSFICDQTYVGRGELALYVKLSLLFDPNGICYATYEELAEGVLKQSKQVVPLMANLIDRHLVLRSPTTVKIPWLGKSVKARYIYQRPSAAYTISRLYFLGFNDDEGNIIKLSKSKFDQCAKTLLHAYCTRHGDSNAFKSNPLLRESRNLSEEELLEFTKLLYELYLTDDEKQLIPFQENDLNQEIDQSPPDYGPF